MEKGEDGGRKEKLLELMHRSKHGLIRMESIVTAGKHLATEALHDGLGLQMKIPKHRVALPAANELDGIRINRRIKEGHGAAGPQGSNADIRREIIVGRSMGGSGGPQEPGELLALDGA